MNFLEVKKMYETKGYRFFENGNYNVNLFSIRSSNNITNKFDDIVGLAYKVDGKEIVKIWKATTDPGFHYNKNHLSNKGVAILQAGQWKYQKGLHNGKPALVQADKVTVWRDINKDLVIDKKVSESGYFGINIHRAGSNSTNVDKWSAGCTVFAKESDFLEFMDIINKSISIYGNKFTYTVFEK